MDVGDIVEKTAKGADELVTSDEERDLIKKDIVLAELNQDDKYTKRARPTVVYAGLALMILEMFGIRLFALSLIFEGEALIQALTSSNNIFMSFLATWGAVVGIYKFSRSQEKRGTHMELRKAKYEKQVQLARIKAERKGGGLFNRKSNKNK